MRLAGASSARHSLRPRIGGRNVQAKLVRNARREGEGVFAVIARSTFVVAIRLSFLLLLHGLLRLRFHRHPAPDCRRATSPGPPRPPRVVDEATSSSRLQGGAALGVGAMTACALTCEFGRERFDAGRPSVTRAPMVLPTRRRQPCSENAALPAEGFQRAGKIGLASPQRAARGRLVASVASTSDDTGPEQFEIGLVGRARRQRWRHRGQRLPQEGLGNDRLPRAGCGRY